MNIRPGSKRTPADRPGYRLDFMDDFDEPELNTTLWLPHHLPHWSSKRQSRARYRLSDSVLTLFIGHDQPAWCPEFDGQNRVSALQTGSFAGPFGSAIGQHRFNPDLRVREEQDVLQCYTPLYGRIVMRARAWLTSNSLASLYLIGFEDEAENSGEITVMEVFGHAVHTDGVCVGRGIKRVNDLRLQTMFNDSKLPVRLNDWHEYAIEWSPEGVIFYLDDIVIGSTDQSPSYNMQLMLTFYNLGTYFSSQDITNEFFEVDYIRGYSFESDNVNVR